MPAPRVYKTEAIVLKRTNLGEADKILTLYTPNLGKLRVFARGVRRTKSKLGGHVELLTRSAMMLAQGKTLDVVSQSETIDSFLPLRSDLWRVSCALYAAELVERFTEEQIENYPIYRLLLETLRRLSEARDGSLPLRYFELHLLGYLGYRPQLDRCVQCEVALKPQQNFFSSSAGGVLCPDCARTEPVARPISVNALKVMRLLQSGDYATASRLRISPELSQGLEHLLRGYIRYLLEREVKSTQWLDRLRESDENLTP